MARICRTGVIGMENPPPWKIEDGVMISQKTDIVTTNQFGDIQLHLEFREPNSNDREGQGRGNSGIFLMGKYEIQVLDCYKNKTYADGTTGAIYGQHPPLANACRPPNEWQTYDIIFNVPHFDTGGKLLSPGYATVTFNGVVVQNHQAIRGNTSWRSPGSYTPVGPTGPIALHITIIPFPSAISGCGRFQPSINHDQNFRPRNQ